MAGNEKSKQMMDVLHSPLGSIIAAVGNGVAQAQQEIDMYTIDTVKKLCDMNDKDASEMRKIGYEPTWYQIPEAKAEIKIALSISQENTQSRNVKTSNRMNANKNAPISILGATVDATYTNKYNYDLAASSSLQFRIVPIPPSSQASQMRIVPQIVGKNWGDAKNILEELSINYRFTEEEPDITDEKLVAKTHPEAGEILRTDDDLLITLKGNVAQ